MIVFPNAKINLGLNILRKRPDNYHDLQSIFLPIDLKDALEVIVDKSIKDFKFTNTGLTIDAPAEKNHVIKAYKLLKNNFDLPPVKIHLHKVIPFGAGIGGGSANASFMLKLLNNLFDLKQTNEKLEEYAKKIGADCPFFIKNKPAYVEGIGDILSDIDYDFSNISVFLVKPNINLNTAKVYSFIKPNENVPELPEELNTPIENWKNTFTNDFENVIFSRHPEISKIKEKMYENGALYSSMSGSGSSVFGFFENINIDIDFDIDCQIFKTKIIS